MLKSLVSFAALAALLFFIAYYAGISQFKSFFHTSEYSPETSFSNDYYELNTPKGIVRFNLVDPESAPADLYDKVMLGYHIVCETTTYAKDYAGDQLCCTHCHFACGNTFGGKGGGLSLIGVINAYPAYSNFNKAVISLRQRINNCFLKSMNGKPLPEDGALMDAIIEYLTYISKPVESIKKAPWLGYIPINIQHAPDPVRGKTVYEVKCATCHKSDGNGEIENNIPAVWGDHSFNDAAGMNKLETMSAFIFANMPYDEPTLNEVDSLDVAAFIIQQPRPHLISD